MKKILIKLLKFFKKEHLSKYIIQIIIFLVVLTGFMIIATENVTSNVLGTVIGFLFSTMILYIIKIISSRFEDMLKVNCNTAELLKIYSGDKNYRKEIVLNGTKVEVAYAESLVNNDYKFEVIDDPNKKFELDDFIMNNYSSIFGAHSNSTKLNTETIRLDKFEKDGDVYKLYLSRSNYFNHLVTNRAADFSIFENISLRDVYEYGPLISNYEESKMSNHIGINGLVFLSDGSLLVPRRKKDSTISKNKITSSIAVKLNPPIDGSNKVDANHLLYQNIIDNLSIRLKIKQEDLHKEAVSVKFLGFGHSLYEAGKPQFYYAITLNDIDTKKYYELNMDTSVLEKIDVDKCVYVADYQSYKFVKDEIWFDVALKNGKKKKVKCKYEMSYLCNLWHYEQYLKSKKK